MATFTSFKFRTYARPDYSKLKTTQPKFWETLGFELPEAEKLAENIENFVAECLDYDQAEQFDYSALLADDYVNAYEVWAKSQPFWNPIKTAG